MINRKQFFKSFPYDFELVIDENFIRVKGQYLAKKDVIDHIIRGLPHGEIEGNDIYGWVVADIEFIDIDEIATSDYFVKLDIVKREIYNKLISNPVKL